MSDYTHSKCGGRLVPIPDPPWFQPGSAPHMNQIEFVRCEKCDLRGEVMGEKKESAYAINLSRYK